MKLLVVDDDPDIRKIVRFSLLRSPEWQVLEAAGAEAALERAASASPDVILLDLHLGTESGAEVLDHLRGDARTREIPVILLTADPDASEIESLRARGCAGVIPKPFDPLTLEVEIRRLMRA